MLMSTKQKFNIEEKEKKKSSENFWVASQRALVYSLSWTLLVYGLLVGGLRVQLTPIFMGSP